LHSYGKASNSDSNKPAIFCNQGGHKWNKMAKKCPFLNYRQGVPLVVFGDRFEFIEDFIFLFAGDSEGPINDFASGQAFASDK